MLIDLVKYPIITEKSSGLIENNQYTVYIDVRLTKKQIKILIENVFNVKVKSVNTHRIPTKKKRIGFIEGHRKAFKKAIITLKSNQSILLFPEN
uniref:Large ribosomal subunit protein uL23c n=1 Tax=Neomeris sp. HV02668 TaxID=1979229 RepID=A0A1W5YJS7_9CHLO|nr:ribosomal protein L23 [Neomeris sp. HV02668]